MKRVTILVVAGMCTATAATAAEEWKVLTVVKKTKDTYYYDAASIRNKKGNVTVTTKFEAGKGGVQKWYMEVDCAQKKYRFLKPPHEWQEFSHASPVSVLHTRVCKGQGETKEAPTPAALPVEKPAGTDEATPSPQSSEAR